MDEKEKGEAFLVQNAKNEGVYVTESGLQYEMIRDGDGSKPGPTDTVEVNYRGTFINRKQFDSSYDRGETIEFALDQVISGWTEGLQLMSVGSEYRFYIPYDLAYGERGAGNVIPPYAALIFDVELIAVK